MMFSKENPKICALCEYASSLQNSSTHMLCSKKGIMASDGTCRRFLYDPLKREPKRQSLLGGYTKEDFSID